MIQWAITSRAKIIDDKLRLMAITRGEKKLIVSCAFGFLAVASVAVFYGYINETPVLVASPRPPVPAPNGVDLALQAAQKLTVPNPPLEAYRDKNPPADPTARAQRYGLARKTAWLAQNKAAFALLRQAQRTPWLQPRRAFSKSPDFKPIKKLGDAKVVESNAHWQRGDPNAALQSGLDIVQLGGDYQRGGDTLAYLAGNALNATAHRVMGHNVPHLDAAQAKAAARRLENLLETRWTLPQALQEEKYVEQKYLLYWFGQKKWRMMGLLGTKAPLWQALAQVHTISKKQILADIGAKYDHEIANTRLPYAAKKAPLAFPNNGFAAFLQSSGRIHFYDRRALTMNRVLMLRLALRAYQLENGAPPPDLKTLVPAYIKAVPADPFGAGEPLRYRTDGKTYTLWSIGSDGVNNGGKAIGWSKQPPKRAADERAKLPPLLESSRGDYVAGKNY